MEHQREERSLGDLFAELARDTSSLVRQEVDLAKTEVTEKATKVGRDVGVIGVGAALAYAALLALIAAAILGIGELIPLWASALIVGIVVAVIGYVVIQTGLSALKRADLTPRETIQSLKEDTEWAKDQLK
jgi:hypothetical protein